MNGYELMQKADITYRQLNHWCDKGWLKFGLEPGVGRGGQQRTFTAVESSVAIRMGKLVHAGMYPEKAAKIARGDRNAINRLLGEVSECMNNGELIYKWFSRPDADRVI